MRLLVIGAGMAAAYLLQELGAEAESFDITIVGDEDAACYNRVLLSSFLAGDSAADELQMLDDNACLSSVRFLEKTRVVAIDPQLRSVELDDGARLSYDQLVIATGASVAKPEVAHTTLKGVEAFRTLADANNLRARASAGAHAVVVGGGLLGLEAAHGLNALGFMTTVVHRQPRLMNRQLDDDGAVQLERTLSERGLHFRLGAEVVELKSEGDRLTAAVLQNGDVLPCELLLFATGIQPNIDLARLAGLDTANGILIDCNMKTSAPDVFALGECSQLEEHCFGLAAPVREQAKVLAKELVGAAHAGFFARNYPTQLKISGIEIFSAGDPGAAGESLYLRDEQRGIYRHLVLRDDRLVAAVLVGDKRGGTWYSELISKRINVSAFRGALMFGRSASESMQLAAVAA
ncbi:MAG: FAD-dependent oxidoreductase [Pseudomonadota bacterium]